jgi:SAM-dependent methyltransferase
MKAALSHALKHFPKLKRQLRRLRDRWLPGRLVSSNYLALQGQDAQLQGQQLRQSWQDSSLPGRQRALVQKQLQQYKNGAAIDVFDVFVQSLKNLPTLSEGMTLLEVGCSSGFYCEVLDIAGLPVAYSGCDYSSAFIDMARACYPKHTFTVEDATHLQRADQSVDIVVSGCCLLHIPEYKQAVAETARVARSYAVFHRTPVVWGQEEKWYRKKAYGVDTVEIHFNEPEFLALLQNNGLELLATYTLDQQSDVSGDSRGQAVRTYVCRKVCL